MPNLPRNRGKAQKAAADKEAELLAPSFDRLAWSRFVELYEEQWMTGLAPDSLKAWRYRCASLERAIQFRYLDEIDAPALHRWVSVMRRDGLRETTIKSYLAAVSAALGWAKDAGLIDSVPLFPKPPRARGVDRKARSRPITGEEYDRLVASVRAGLLLFTEEKRQSDERRRAGKPKRKRSPAAIAKAEAKYLADVAADVPVWCRFLRGLWLSGLRVNEAVALSWDWGAAFAVDLTGQYPVYRIQVKGQKSARDQVAPMAPEFAAWLRQIPEAERRGRVLGVTITHRQASRVVSAIGRRAGIVVASDGKTATAHDLRRSFGTRWAMRVSPAVLKELMRHRDISTTMQYYVELSHRDLAAELWRHVGSNLGEILGETPLNAAPASTTTVIANPPNETT